MKKISLFWIFVAIVIAIAATYIYFNKIYIPDKTFSVSKRKNYDIVTLVLPNTVNPDIFGPKYWEAYHKLTNMIPCTGCRNQAVPFMNFFHDTVNVKTDKPIFDKDNFNNHIAMISNLPKA